MKVFCVNGFPCSGKDFFCDYIKDNTKLDVYKFSTIDKVKETAYLFGWNGEKNEISRLYLSKLKSLFTVWLDGPFNDIRKKINSINNFYENYDVPTKKVVVFIMSREPDEINRFKNELQAKSILIYRPLVEKDYKNHSDNDVLLYNYDYIINNDSTLVNFVNQINKFIDEVLYDK